MLESKLKLYAWVALAVLLSRLAFVTYAPQRNLYGNAPGLLAIASNLAAGKGYIGEDGRPDSYFNPGYPMFLAGCKLVSGDSLWPIKLAQILLDVGTALALCSVLRQACSPAAALLFGIAFGLHPLFIHLNNNVNDEPLLMFLLIASFAVLYGGLREPRFWRFVVAALLTAAATYTKGTPIFLPFGIAAALVILRRKESYGKLRYWAVYVAVFVAALLPWACRNYVVFGRFAFSIRGIATNLWWGSDPRIFASYGEAQRAAAAEIEKEMEAKGVLPPEHNTVFNREQWRLRMAIRSYKDSLNQPARLAKIMAMKATRTLYASEDRPSVHLPLILLQVPTIGLAIYGFVRLWKRAGTRALATLALLYIGYYYAAVAVGMPILRYFEPVLPLVLAVAAVAVSGFIERVQSATHSTPRIATAAA